ncbi:MAG: adenosylmethionine decarboxylase [Planctomycetales bacterium]|nr:adenosylmethionine decarboxylase [Planctomycetales bacterium]
MVPVRHEFTGRHLLLTYSGCDPAVLCDPARLLDALRQAVAASGATLVESVSHEFTPAGFTAVLLLSESHASIHTFPEHSACFVDLFTCGVTCDHERFAEELQVALRPTTVERRLIQRDHPSSE